MQVLVSAAEGYFIVEASPARKIRCQKSLGIREASILGRRITVSGGDVAAYLLEKGEAATAATLA